MTRAEVRPDWRFAREGTSAGALPGRNHSHRGERRGEVDQPGQDRPTVITQHHRRSTR